MLTAREQRRYPLPDDLGEIVRVAIDDTKQCGAFIAIAFVHNDEMVRLVDEEEREPKMGVPARAAIVNDEMWLWPLPDAEYALDAVYLPRPKKF